jgi:hypothetical protein
MDSAFKEIVVRIPNTATNASVFMAPTISGPLENVNRASRFVRDFLVLPHEPQRSDAPYRCEKVEGAKV